MPLVSNTKSAMWLPAWRESHNEASLWLICVPHAGGMHTAFAKWREFLPTSVEIRAVAMPGRGPRFREEPIRDMHAVVAGIAKEIESLPCEQLALFGESSGSIVALSLAQALQASGRLRVRHLFAAGIPNPITVDLRPRYKLNDEDFGDWVAELGLLPRQLMADIRSREYLLQQIRNDFKLVETYLGQSKPLECDITTFVGTRDPLVRKSFTIWSSLTTREWRHFELDCGHLVNIEGNHKLASVLASHLVKIAPPTAI